MEMKFKGTFDVTLPRGEVYEVLCDPRKFTPMLPTFHSMEMKDENTANVKIKIGIGRIRGTASTDLTLEEAEAPVHARYVGRGKVMQSAYQISYTFDLEDAPGGGTTINWAGDTELAGKILSLAGGGLKGYAEKEINSLILSVQQGLAPGAPPIMAPPERISWLQRLLAWLRGGKEEQAVEQPVPQESAPAVGLAAQPDEVRQTQQEARDRIGRLLQVERSEKPMGRKEDSRLVRGRGLFVDDYKPAGALHMSLLRSPYAHARIVKIDTTAAEAVPGVVCTLTGEELAAQVQPFLQIGEEPGALIEDYPLAEPVAHLLELERVEVRVDVHAHLAPVDEDLRGAVLVRPAEDPVVVRRRTELVHLFLEHLDLLLRFLEDVHQSLVLPFGVRELLARELVAAAQRLVLSHQALEASAELGRIAPEQADRVLQILQLVAVRARRPVIAVVVGIAPGCGRRRRDAAHHVSHEALLAGPRFELAHAVSSLTCPAEWAKSSWPRVLQVACRKFPSRNVEGFSRLFGWMRD